MELKQQLIDMKELSEYITEYVSSGRGGKMRFPELNDLKKVIDFLEIKGFSDITPRDRYGVIKDILPAFKRSKEPAYVYDASVINEKGEKSYWLRFFYSEEPTKEITEENPIFSVSYNASYGTEHYFIEKTVGEVIKEISREEFLELLKSRFGWSLK